MRKRKKREGLSPSRPSKTQKFHSFPKICNAKISKATLGGEKERAIGISSKSRHRKPRQSPHDLRGGSKVLLGRGTAKVWMSRMLAGLGGHSETD